MFKISTTALAAAKTPLCSEAEAAAFECAREIIPDMMGICSAELATELATLAPDPERVTDPKAKRLAYAREGAEIAWHDQQNIMRILLEYGAQVRLIP